ncbi:hemerythrin domain-containing protein [Polyangium jinanense]|uniref:Hemerythrin domain-containing protein n=1 Tax=Polyangium jinanense TaxID=2829994 RepID=A0A9X4ATH4_9BACT|nr:hemerythrin domain-containing protein [Polyangium jinanense]MDC3954349.1 hemerythrin domain-containing protein [Polyangium jinanense]MDC3984199.1 hemerythrin domain-containing protein [Polyangium jinanense]
MKATDLLRSHHREIVEVLQRFHKNLGTPEIEPLQRELATLLAAHLRAEREIFYPECAEALNDLDVMRPPYLRQVDLVNKLRSVATSKGDVDTVRSLAREVELALQDHFAEESEFYVRIEAIMGEKALEDLGGELETAHAEGMEQGFEPFLAEGAVEEGDLERYAFQRRERAARRTVPMKEPDIHIRKDAPAAIRHAAANVAEDQEPSSGHRSKLAETTEEEGARKAGGSR